MRETKDSGIAWVGDIPSNWDVHPLYYYFQEHKHKNALGTEQNLLSLSYGKIIRKDINTTEGLLPENFNTYNIIEEKDIVLRLTDLQNDKRSLRTGIARERGIITSAYVTLRSVRSLSPSYFHYLLHTYDLLKVLYNMGSGVRQGLNYEELSKVNLIEPPLDEQQKIAIFLDDKCGKIDSLIADIQAQIDTLEQFKRSQITKAVTKGLTPDTGLKESGLAWIGNVPSHWKIMPNKYLMKKLKLIQPVYTGEDIISLTVNGVIKRDLDNPSGKMPASFDGYQFVYPGNLLMCLFDIDVTPRCIGLIKDFGLTSPAYSQFVLNSKADAGYYYYYYLNLDFNKDLLHLAKNQRHSLNEEQFGAIPTVVPPIEEQKAIAAYLDEKCAEIDGCIAAKKEQISTLEAYKKSVIFEYVTGKKEVV